jgi:hypothetical protein
MITVCIEQGVTTGDGDVTTGRSCICAESLGIFSGCHQVSPGVVTPYLSDIVGQIG